MKKKLLKILSTTLLLAAVSIPAYASVAESDLTNYNNKLTVIKNEFSNASAASNTNGIYNSETKSKALLNELNNYINANVPEDFKTECNNTVNVMNKYREYQSNQLQDQEKKTGFGSSYGREGSRINTRSYLDTCSLLLNDLQKYSTSFEYYVKESDPDNKHWKKEDGKWHYYDKDGNKLANATVDGYVLGGNGDLILY